MYAYRRGQGAESIQQSFPLLTLEEIYGAIAFYLANQQDVDRSIEEEEIEFEKMRLQSRKKNASLYERLAKARAEMLIAKMRVAFLADADLNDDIVKGIRRLVPEIDFRNANDAGLEGLADAKVLEIAANDDRILVTDDRRTMPDHFANFILANVCPGVLIVSKKIEHRKVIDELVLIWSEAERRFYKPDLRDPDFVRLEPTESLSKQEDLYFLLQQATSLHSGVEI